MARDFASTETRCSIEMFWPLGQFVYVWVCVCVCVCVCLLPVISEQDGATQKDHRGTGSMRAHVQTHRIVFTCSVHPVSIKMTVTVKTTMTSALSPMTSVIVLTT